MPTGSSGSKKNGASAEAALLNSTATRVNESRRIGVATLRSVDPPTFAAAGDGATQVAGDGAAQVGPGGIGRWLAELSPNAHPLVVPLRRHLSRGTQFVSSSDVDEPQWVQWSWAVNAIWIDESKRRIFDPAGRLLFDLAKLDDPDHSHPEAVIPCSLDARQRQADIQMELRNRLVDPVEGLIPIPGAEEVCLREPSEVGRRILALFLIATRAESIMAGHALEADKMKVICPIGFDAMSADEHAFFSGTDPQRSEQLVWRYESLLALQWALDMQFDLAWPDEHADLVAVTRLMVDLPDQSIVDQARLRSTNELLNAAERHHQLYYCIAMAQTQNLDAPAGISGGVVCERLIALAWLLGLSGDWDATVNWVENGMIEAG